MALLASMAVPARSAPATLAPIEHCYEDSSFTAFREALKAAVAKKDREAFLAMVAPDVLVNFGGASGPNAFAEEWSFDATEHGNIWDQLGTMLKLGCALSDDGARIIPSFLMQMDSDDEDPFDAVVILPGAKLYRETGVESDDPSTVPWTLAPVTSRAGDLVTGVRLPDGREGYISDDELYPPLGHRMVIEKRDGKWMITAFVAGD
ncbi:MAG TPA: hypothetical protein VFU80_05605 [Sphingomicrobium sp.]|nr:hypothetical protein [Sphingomicrobium sp.]